MKWPSITDWFRRKQDDFDPMVVYREKTYRPDVQFPHCDSLILHSPGKCEFCDQHKDWQRLRIAEGIAFSDMSEHDRIKQRLKPCPSTYRRPAHIRDQWHGNVPKESA